MIIVTGCGRSGTYYMYMILRSLGFDVGHETWGIDGQVGFHAAVELRGAKPGSPWRNAVSDTDIVLHQVRYPLHTISSFQTAQNYTWEYVCPHIQSSIDEPLTLRCMKYWYYWNLMAEQHAKLTYLIESLDDRWPLICRLLGIPDNTPLPAETHKGWHKRGHTQLQWNDLKKVDKPLYYNIKELARKYRYKV